MFDQPSFLKGIGVGMRDILRVVERELSRPEVQRSPARKATLLRVKHQAEEREEANQALYEKVVEQRNEQEAADQVNRHERLRTMFDQPTDGPTAQEVAGAAMTLLAYSRQGMGTMHPLWQQEMRLIERAIGGPGFSQ